MLWRPLTRLGRCWRRLPKLSGGTHEGSVDVTTRGVIGPDSIANIIQKNGTDVEMESEVDQHQVCMFGGK